MRSRLLRFLTPTSTNTLIKQPTAEMNATHTDHPPSPVITAIVPNGGLSMQYINTTPQANYSDDPFALEVGLNSIATLGPTQELSNSSLTVVSPLIMAKTEGEELGMLFDEGFEVGQVAMFDNTMTGGITPEETIPSHQDQQIMIQQTAHAGKWYRRMRDRKRQTGTNTLPLRWNRLTGEVFDLDAGHVNSEQENSGQQKCLRSATPTFQRSASYYSAELEPVPVGPQQTGANLIPLGIHKRHQTFHSIPSTPKSGMTPLPPPTKQKARTRGKKWSMLNATARFDEGDRSPLDEQHWYRNRPALRRGGRRERSGSPHYRLSSHRDYRESRTQRRRRQRINSHRSELRYCHSTNGAQDQIYLSSVDSNWVPAGLSSMALGPTDPGPNPASEFPFLAVSHYEPPNIQQEGIYYPPLPATKSNRFGNRPSAAVQDQLATLEWIGESYLHPLAIDLVAETHGSFGVTRGKSLAAELLGNRVLFHVSQLYASNLRDWLGEINVSINAKLFRAYVGTLAENNREENGMVSEQVQREVKTWFTELFSPLLDNIIMQPQWSRDW